MPTVLVAPWRVLANVQRVFLSNKMRLADDNELMREAKKEEGGKARWTTEWREEMYAVGDIYGE
ncbi:hypothetical protein BWQ96_04862 [Gracilariopsis chorda]|uniref:Uncharacterized protein n=1 Tax=Gracilariopsis chorda TaxID=448386 RepID=A0A2V3ITB4_9FLOR|nr:hypothetical protein BWQ96_04862 [Gracilariopsis chorda]|eukprot:PXF45342.1 hypothetical protein BWQ96_04862 [Gracilariopsis chorda]